VSPTEHIASLRAAVQRAQEELDAYLKEEFPTGARVSVVIRRGQTNRSSAVVEQVWNGEVQVKLDRTRARSNPYRWLQVENIEHVGHRP